MFWKVGVIAALDWNEVRVHHKVEKLQPSPEGDGFSGFTWSIGLWHCQDASVRVLRAGAGGAGLGAGVLVLAPSDASQGADVRYLDLTWGQCFNCFC